MPTVTRWYKGQVISEAEFERLQAERAVRRPIECVDRCLLVRGGGSLCLKRASGGGLWRGLMFDLKWKGAKICRDGDLYAAVRGVWWSDRAGTRGWVKLRASFSPDDQRGEIVYFRRYAGLLPSEPLPAWVGDPLGNLRKFGRDISQWEN